MIKIKYPVEFEILCYKLIFDGNFCIFDNIDSLQESIKNLLEEEDPGQTFKIEQKIYTNLELDSMEEFKGW